MSDLWLFVLEGSGAGDEHPLNGEQTLGRDPTADLVIPDRSVSRRHASVRVEGATAVVEDLGSRNGTFVNGQAIDSPCRLREGDVIGLGGTLLELRSSPDNSPETPPPITPTEVHRAPRS
jgi:pSer/pThr/pTyr-binding forkhead associated (FHA) protein